MRNQERPERRPVVLGVVAALLLTVVVGSVLPTRAAFTASVTETGNTISTARYYRCATALGLERDWLVLFWPLVDYRTGSQPDQSNAGRSGTYNGSVAWVRTDPMACPADSGDAYVLDGSTSYVSSVQPMQAPQEYTTEIWFRTTVPSGKLIGFESTSTGPGNAYDRHVYLTTDGRLAMGAYDPSASPTRHTIVSPTSVTDGQWHQVIAVMSKTAGATLWLDGRAVAADPTMRAPDGYEGYWRVGQGTLDNWPDRGGGSTFFTGSLRYATVSLRATPAADIRLHHDAGRPSPSAR